MATFSQKLRRAPQRLTRSLQRLFDPHYRVQLAANLAVPLWLPREVRSRLDRVPGTSSKREARLLAHLAHKAPTGGVFVEIGAFKGKTTALLVEVASLRPDKPAVVSIDPHQRDTWEEFNRTIRTFGLDQRGLEVHRSYSHDVGKSFSRPISFLWIDGSHAYDDVVLDIADFTPHVLPGAHVVFDDAAGGHFPGVEQALSEWDHHAAGFEDLGAVKRFRLFRRRQG